MDITDILENLEKNFGELGGIRVSFQGDEKESDISKPLELLVRRTFESSQIRILRVADKLFKGTAFDGLMSGKDKKFQPEEVDVNHDFYLGDRVELKVGSLTEFKSIQKRIGWNKRLSMVYGQRGIVTGVASKHDHCVEVLFPKVFSELTIYVPLLKKIEDADNNSPTGRWKSNDFVTTISEPRLAKSLQTGFGIIPKQHLGKRGRVTAILNTHVEVTFDEKKSFHIHPAALLPSGDCTPIKMAEIENFRGFKIGDKVEIIKNLKKLVKNQVGKGGWNPSMTLLRGKKVTIVDIHEDGTITVQPTDGRSWRLSSMSVKLAEETDVEDSDLKFLPSDIVMIKRAPALRFLLNKMKIPPSFLEYLRCPATMTLVDDDLDIYISFNDDQNVESDAKVLRRLTQEEKKHHDKVQNAVKELRIGCKVHLDVGPPNYVRDVLSKVNMNVAIKMAMTKSATLLGFTGYNHAVIEYSAGMRYKINQKYLTVPDKFHAVNSPNELELTTVQKIQETVSRYVQESCHEEDPENEDSKVEILSMSQGQPPTVKLKVQSSVGANAQEFVKWLHKNSEWKVLNMCEGHLVVRGIDGRENEININIYFNDEEFDVMPPVGKILDEANPMPSHVEVEAGSILHRPFLTDVKDFRYMRLHDPSLNRELYFPYVLHATPSMTHGLATNSLHNQTPSVPVIETMTHIVTSPKD